MKKNTPITNSVCWGVIIKSKKINNMNTMFRQIIIHNGDTSIQHKYITMP